MLIARDRDRLQLVDLSQWLADHEEPMLTKDGYLMVGAAGKAIWARCAKALGHPEW
jgi:hypothetical protein